MGRSQSLSKAKEFISAQGGKIAPLGISEEELNPQEQEDSSLKAYPLESMDSCYRVDFDFPEDSLCSEFAFFEDGKQRTIQIGYIPVEYGNTQILIPVHYFVISAVILQREGRELKLWKQAQIRQGVFVEKSLIPNQEIFEEFINQGLDIVDIHGQGGDYYALRKKTLQEAKKMRLQLETELIADWRLSKESEESFLVVDGTLMNFRNEKNVERCIGVSKSFGNRYFSVSDHNRVLRMREFERSWAFRFHSPDDVNDSLNQGARERLSWYLRLRDGQNADPEFGLIRVEIGLKHIDDLTDKVKKISRSLLSERLPISYPIPRWDKHLYPIFKCESYLASVMPSINTISAAMKG